MMNYYKNLPETTKGIIELVVGVALLLYTLDIGKKFFGALLIVVAILMIVSGFIRADWFKKIQDLLQKKNKPQQ